MAEKMNFFDVLGTPSVSPDGQIGVGDAVGNWFTGNADYTRSLQLAQYANAFSASEAEKARRFSALEAEKNRDFQRIMSNTAYQRQAADLKAAGFNPALLLNAGGASSPSGSMASTSSASATNARFSSSQGGMNAMMSLFAALLTKGMSLGAQSAMSAASNEAMLEASTIRSNTAFDIEAYRRSQGHAAYRR